MTDPATERAELAEMESVLAHNRLAVEGYASRDILPWSMILGRQALMIAEKRDRIAVLEKTPADAGP